MAGNGITSTKGCGEQNGEAINRRVVQGCATQCLGADQVIQKAVNLPPRA